VTSQPARLLARMRRDDDLVRPLLELDERVPDSRDRIGLDDEARGGDALRAQRLERPLQPAPGRGAAGVLVDDVALAGLVDRADDRDPERPLRAAALERPDQALAGDGLVGDHEHVLHRTGASSSSTTRSPLKTACRAPATPYSYG